PLEGSERDGLTFYARETLDEVHDARDLPVPVGDHQIDGPPPRAEDRSQSTLLPRTDLAVARPVAFRKDDERNGARAGAVGKRGELSAHVCSGLHLRVLIEPDHVRD